MESITGSGAESWPLLQPARECGAVRNPLQEVEQSRGHCCGLPEGLGLSVEVRLESDLRRSPDGDHLSRSLGQGLSATEIRKESIHNGSLGEGLRWESGMDRSW